MRRSRKEFRFDKNLLPQSASLTAPPKEEPIITTVSTLRYPKGGLKQADDAIYVDNAGQSLEYGADYLLDIIKEHLKR